MSDQPYTNRFPLLEDMLALRGMKLLPTFTVRETANLFGVSPRAIQTRVASGQLPSRDLPGRAKFLPTDLEHFLQNSHRRRSE